MSNEEDENEDLKAFERAMASLHPRADRLDPAWRSLLAEEISLTAARLADSGAGAQRTMARCEHPGGHRFVCLHCGGDARALGRVRRWAWPASLATMTSVAAVLLAMLLAGRHGPTAGEAGTSMPSSHVATASPEEKRCQEPLIAEEQRSQEPLIMVPDTLFLAMAQWPGNPYGGRQRAGRRPSGSREFAGGPHGRTKPPAWKWSRPASATASSCGASCAKRE